MSENLSVRTENRIETVQIEMQARVKRLAYPCDPGESVQSCVRRVARMTGLSFGQIKRLWYSEWRVIPTHVSDKIRETALQHEHQINIEIDRQRRRLNDLYALVNHSSDSEFYSTAVAQAIGRTDEPE